MKIDLFDDEITLVCPVVDESHREGILTRLYEEIDGIIVEHGSGVAQESVLGVGDCHSGREGLVGIEDLQRAARGRVLEIVGESRDAGTCGAAVGSPFE